MRWLLIVCAVLFSVLALYQYLSGAQSQTAPVPSFPATAGPVTSVVLTEDFFSPSEIPAGAQGVTRVRVTSLVPATITSGRERFSLAPDQAQVVQLGGAGSGLVCVSGCVGAVGLVVR